MCDRVCVGGPVYVDDERRFGVGCGYFDSYSVRDRNRPLFERVAVNDVIVDVDYCAGRVFG